MKALLKLVWSISIDLFLSLILSIILLKLWLISSRCNNPFCGVVWFYTFPVSLILVSVILLLLKKRISGKILIYGGLVSFVPFWTLWLYQGIDNVYGVLASTVLSLIISSLVGAFLVYLSIKNKI